MEHYPQKEIDEFFNKQKEAVKKTAPQKSKKGYHEKNFNTRKNNKAGWSISKY